MSRKKLKTREMALKVTRYPFALPRDHVAYNPPHEPPAFES